MDGFTRPNQHRKSRQTTPQHTQSAPRQPHEDSAAPQPTPSPSQPPTVNQAEAEPSSRQVSPPPKKRRKRGLYTLLLGCVVLVMVVLSGVVWYVYQIQPVNDAEKDAKQQFVVAEGASFSKVAADLEARELIRDSFAFNLLGRLQGARGDVKAGTCSLSPAMSSPEILDKITSGCQDFQSITFYPGATIEKPFYKSPSATLSQTLYVKNVLREAGYSDEEITEALNASYDGPLFAGKPADTTLEGYIYGETYYVDTDASARAVLETAFEEMYKVVKEYDLPEAYQQQGLKTLYDGITMASIVQRELNCEDKPTKERKSRCYEYQRTIAQVLLKRLREGIPLGADVTFIYAADMAKKQPTTDFDSPYNTRINQGLPPGPIGTPGELALRAVADPSDTDYLYFVAGDDGLIYFSKTQAEHDENTKKYCKTLCFELE